MYGKYSSMERVLNNEDFYLCDYSYGELRQISLLRGYVGEIVLSIITIDNIGLSRVISLSASKSAEDVAEKIIGEPIYIPSAMFSGPLCTHHDSQHNGPKRSLITEAKKLKRILTKFAVINLGINRDNVKIGL